MSIIIARPKHRASHPRGYRLHAIEDGVAPRPDEVTVRLQRSPGGWYAKRELLADQQAKRSKEPALSDAPEHMIRVLTHGGPEEGTLVAVPKASPKVRTSKSGRRTKSQVDAWIRATGYQGPINKVIRDLARDVIAHQESVRKYAGEE